jgi:hypothetical protein
MLPPHYIEPHIRNNTRFLLTPPPLDIIRDVRKGNKCRRCFLDSPDLAEAPRYHPRPRSISQTIQTYLPFISFYYTLLIDTYRTPRYLITPTPINNTTTLGGTTTPNPTPKPPKHFNHNTSRIHQIYHLMIL